MSINSAGSHVLHESVEAPKYASQQLAKALAGNGHICIYVNPHLGLQYETPFALSPEPRLHNIGKGIFEFHIHLPGEHEVTKRLFTPAEVRRIVKACDRLLAESGIDTAIQLTSLPVWRPVLEKLRPVHGFPILYDCHDYLAGFKRLAPEIVAAEDALLSTCDMVTFSSKHLMYAVSQRMPALTARTALIRNAADPRQFERLQVPEPRGAERIIGYLGALDHWFDVDAVWESARAHSSWSFVLVGRVEDERVNRLRELPNVRFAGEIPHEAIPEHLATWDVAMIPFLRNSLTMATNPIKIYEYLSAGLPVVGACLPELELFGNLVYLADTCPQFAALIAEAMRENSPSLRTARREVVEGETWRQRADSLLSLVECTVAKVAGPGS
jgi:glycosyltransferase involved in cell wall biosynthesis